MNTRLTGRGLHAAAPCCSQAAISAFSQPASTTLPSTPAVLRPALTSVTRRTLTNAFAREPSISFCRLRTFFRSPALLAVKIRCRSRRTSSSTARQPTASQSRTSPSGPFAAAAAPNLPIGSGASNHQVHTGSPDPRQLPFGPGIRPYPASYPGTASGGASTRCPVSCRLSATGLRFLGHPAPAGELSLPHGRPTGSNPPAGPQRGCRVAHEQDATGQGALFTPGMVVRSRPTTTFRPALAALLRPVPAAPLKHPIGEVHFHEASTRVHA